MFEVHGTRIRLTQGDTGLLTIKVRSERPLTDDDRAVFTVRRPSGGIMAEMVLTPQEDGTVQVPFTNALTDGWKPGIYAWDVRYVLGAVIDGGKVTDGREVITPMSPGQFEITRAVGQI